MKHIERIAVVIAVVLLGGTLVVGYERSGEVPTPVPSRAAAPPTTQPSSIQLSDADAATHTVGPPATLLANGRQPRPEDIVRLPRQIQNQVARAELTPAPTISDGEMLTLPWHIPLATRAPPSRCSRSIRSASGKTTGNAVIPHGTTAPGTSGGWRRRAAGFAPPR